MFFVCQKWRCVSYKHFSFQGNEPIDIAAREFLRQDLTVIVLYTKGFYGTDPKKNYE